MLTLSVELQGYHLQMRTSTYHWSIAGCVSTASTAQPLLTFCILRRAEADRQAREAAQREAAAHPDSLPHLCRVLHVTNASRIAIVGSTALSATEQTVVQTADTVLCFDGIHMRQALRLDHAECAALSFPACLQQTRSVTHYAMAGTTWGRCNQVQCRH